MPEITDEKEREILKQLFIGHREILRGMRKNLAALEKKYKLQEVDEPLKNQIFRLREKIINKQNSIKDQNDGYIKAYRDNLNNISILVKKRLDERNNE